MKKKLQALAIIFTCFAMLISVTACRKNEETISKTDSSDLSVSEESESDTSNNSEDELFGTGDDIINDFDNSSDLVIDNSLDNVDTEIDEPLYTVDKDDKPYVKYPAYLENPMKSNYDSQANSLRNEILSSKDELPKSVTGKIWYVSNDGRVNNPGNSPNKAWDSISTLEYNSANIKPGDAVLFERGDVFRGVLNCQSGVYYGAYGNGDKPCIYGSDQNYAKAKWTYKNANIWVCDAPFSADVGTIIFNHGEFIGYKKFKNYQLEQNGDFWCDNQNSYRLYMYMDKNPSDAYKSIEIGTNEHIVNMKSVKNVTFENLCIKYTGAHGFSIRDGCENIVVRGCEIGFIGGSASGDVRYGNGIEIWKAGTNILLEKNWVYQIYDSGITPQGAGEYIVKDITMRKNLIEYCGMGSFEYFLAGEWDVCRGENVIFADNICRFAGYNWAGKQRSDKVSKHIRSDYTCRNTIFNFQIKNNIFDQATIDIVGIGGTAVTVKDIPQDPKPILSGNIYAQNKNGDLGTYFSKYGVFDDDAEYFVKEIIGDKQATIYFY